LYSLEARNTTINLAKFFIGVVGDQSALDHGQEIAVIITDNEPYRTVAPSPSLLELSEPLSVLPIGFIKGHPWAANKVQSTHQ
jgi:hypothetical protein